MEWTTGLEHWSTRTLETSSVTAGYALYPCITQLRRTLDSVSTWRKHGELAVIIFGGVAYHSTHAFCHDWKGYKVHFSPVLLRLVVPALSMRRMIGHAQKVMIWKQLAPHAFAKLKLNPGFALAELYKDTTHSLL